MVAARPALSSTVALACASRSPALRSACDSRHRIMSKGEPRVLLSALERAGAEHCSISGVCLVEFLREHGEASVTLASLCNCQSQSVRHGTPAAFAQSRRGAHAPGCDERGVYLAGGVRARPVINRGPPPGSMASHDARTASTVAGSSQ